MIYRTLLRAAFSIALLLGTVSLCDAQSTTPFVRDIDNPARQPIQFNAFVSFTSGDTLANVDSPFIVPNGKRLVIETITGEIFVPKGQQIRPTLITTASGNFGPNHTLVFDSKVTFGFQDIYRATLP